MKVVQQQQRPLYGPLSGTTLASRYQKKHSPTHHPDHHPIFISFFRLPRSIASSLFKLRAWQSFCTTSLHVLFGLPLGLEPSASYSIHFFTQSVSSFHSACPCHHSLFSCSIGIISSIPSLYVLLLFDSIIYILMLAWMQELYNPLIWGPPSYYDELARIQTEMLHEKEKEAKKSKVSWCAQIWFLNFISPDVFDLCRLNYYS